MATPIQYPWETPPENGTCIQVAEGVFWVRMPLPMALDHVNCYVLDDGDGWTIVDTGVDSKLTRRLWLALLDTEFAKKPVKRVIGTHHHPDHIGLAGWFQSDHGAEFVATRTTWLFARMLTLDTQSRPTAETLTFWRSAGMDPEIYEKRANERPFNFSDIVTPMPLGFTRIKEGDVIEIGRRQWDIRIGNGHSPEHATFWSRDDNLVISGDQIIPSISSNLGVYATEPMADPVAEWLESCERFLPFATEKHLCLGGHKRPFTGLPTRLRQLIDNHHGALERLKKHLVKPQTAADCFLPLFKRNITEGEYGLALVEAIAHLNHLYLAGQVDRLKRDDGAWVYSLKG